MTRHNVYLCQVNNRYGDNVFLPYSVGMLQAYCLTQHEIAEHFDFKGFIYLREDPEIVADRMRNPRIVGISCYIWNWEYNKALCRSIKAKHPDCLIVLGGPHVPMRSEGFFQEHPYADILVHYEGELPFSDILREFLSSSPDYTRIRGLSVKVDGFRTCKTGPREPNLDLSTFTSPYLSGVFDDIMKDGYAFHASQETHRGCPYSCTFCSWGASVLTRVRPFDDQRLQEELDWFGQNKIELLYNCDANYGLLARDYRLTVRLAETKAKYGYPKKFRAAYAKNSNQRVFDIAKVLNDADMSKGVTLSFQSLNDRTLHLIKRANIKIGDFATLMRKYRVESVPTYTELILGCPGETYESFADGIAKLISAGQHDSLNIYTCIVLPNAEMGDRAYQEVHGIQTVRTPVLLTHSTPSDDSFTEHNDVVIGTDSMPKDDWIRAYMFSWAVQCFHCLGLTQYLAIFLASEFGASYRTIYEELVTFIQVRPETMAGRQYKLVREMVAGVTEGGSWGLVIQRFGSIVWPAEEGTFLNIVCDKSEFYTEMWEFVRSLTVKYSWELDDELLVNLLSYQAGMIIDPFSPKSFSIKLKYDLDDFFQKAYLGERIPLNKSPNTIEVRADSSYGGDLETFAREVIWYGRKGGRFRHSNVTVRLATVKQ